MHNGYHYVKENGESTASAAFITGALVGAGVGLLFAPERGTELRSKLCDYANQTKDELMEQGRGIWDTVVERAKEYSDKGEEVVREAGRSQENMPNRDSRRAGKSIKEFA